MSEFENICIRQQQDKINNFLYNTLFFCLMFWTLRIGVVKPVEIGLVLFVCYTLLLKRISFKLLIAAVLFFMFCFLSLIWAYVFIAEHSNLVMDNQFWAIGHYAPFTLNTYAFIQISVIAFFLFNCVSVSKNSNSKVSISSTIVKLCIMIQILYCAYQFFVLHNTQDRLCGTFAEKGPLSLYIAFAVIFLLEKNQISKISVATVFLFLFLILGTRGEIILAFYCGIKIIRSMPKMSVSKTGSIFLAGLLVCFLLYETGVFGYFLYKFQLYYSYFSNASNEYNATGRYAVPYLVPRIFNSHPLTGVGLGNYVFVRNMSDYIGHLPFMANDYAGNLFAESIAEFGLIGSVIYLGYLFYFIFQLKTLLLRLIFIFAAISAVKNDYVYFMMLGFFIVNQHLVMPTLVNVRRALEITR